MAPTKLLNNDVSLYHCLADMDWMVSTNLVIRDTLVLTLVWICIQFVLCYVISQSLSPWWLLRLLFSVFLFDCRLLLLPLLSFSFFLLCTIRGFTILLIVIFTIFSEIFFILDSWDLVSIIRLTLGKESLDGCRVLRLFLGCLSCTHLGWRNFLLFSIDYCKSIRESKSNLQA